ncbi:hypothetical protein [Chitinimonas koreensis]|uniref:hypothetical protein n=1 Tax=Chitinimonas koreensis TaxID=356302 RepID=UPI00041C5CB8|nr:hypothetical protein [Chitinimonas koreensis]QNM95441.1 hypothetical protein H9L41_16430 [Chitinimonas koreensis]
MQPTDRLTAEMLTAMLSVTRITSENMQRALHDHLVLGDPQATAAARYGYSKQQLNVHVRHINGKIRPAFDHYAELVSIATSAGGAGDTTAALPAQRS